MSGTPAIRRPASCCGQLSIRIVCSRTTSRPGSMRNPQKTIPAISKTIAANRILSLLPGERRISRKRTNSNPRRIAVEMTNATATRVIYHAKTRVLLSYAKPMKTKLSVLPLILCCAINAFTQTPDRQFIRTDAKVIALTHVRVIDGTGAAPKDDQTIIINEGKIQSVEPAATAKVPANAQTLDLNGYTVLPGLVGMHNHMFFPMGGSPPMYSNMGISFPRLFLALGVTTIRTAVSVAPYTDLEIKKLIDAGRMIGPKMHITAPYLEGAGSFTPVMHALTGPEDARKLVNYWADLGATSFKAYMNIARAELRAVVEEAHKRGLKVTGHLCSIGYKEAAEIGIDNLEHGLFADSEFVANKQPDQCPQGVSNSLRQLDLNGAPAQEMIRTLVSKNVAVTSTLPVFEADRK